MKTSMALVVVGLLQTSVFATLDTDHEQIIKDKLAGFGNKDGKNFVQYSHELGTPATHVQLDDGKLHKK